MSLSRTGLSYRVNHFNIPYFLSHSVWTAAKRIVQTHNWRHLKRLSSFARCLSSRGLMLKFRLWFGYPANTHIHRLMGIHRNTQTHTLEQHHKSIGHTPVSHLQIKQPGQWNQPWEKTCGLFTAAIAWESKHRDIISKTLPSDGYINIWPSDWLLRSSRLCISFQINAYRIHLFSLHMTFSEMQVVNYYCWLKKKKVWFKWINNPPSTISLRLDKDIQVRTQKVKKYGR